MRGGGDGSARETPMAVADAVAAARPGTQIYFLRGKYTGCFEFTKENGGTYDDPVVLYAERNADGSIGVSVACCNSKREPATPSASARPSGGGVAASSAPTITSTGIVIDGRTVTIVPTTVATSPPSSTCSCGMPVYAG